MPANIPSKFRSRTMLTLTVVRLGAIALAVFSGPIAQAESAKTYPAGAQVMHQEPWQARKAKFIRTERSYSAATVTAPARDQLGSELIAMLKTEGAYVVSGKRLTEEYTEYYANLIGAVARLSDESALDALLIRSVLETGAMATRGVAAFGQRALPRLIDEIDKNPSDSDITFNMMLVFRDMLSGIIRPGNELDSASRARIREIAVRNLGSADDQLRALSVTLIGRFDDPEATQLVSDLANAGPETPVVVRNAARAALEVRAPSPRRP